MGCDALYATVGDTIFTPEVQIRAWEALARNRRKLGWFQRKKHGSGVDPRAQGGRAALSDVRAIRGMSCGAENPSSFLWLWLWHQLWEFPCFKWSGFDTGWNQGVGWCFAEGVDGMEPNPGG